MKEDAKLEFIFETRVKFNLLHLPSSALTLQDFCGSLDPPSKSCLLDRILEPKRAVSKSYILKFIVTLVVNRSVKQRVICTFYKHVSGA